MTTKMNERDFAALGIARPVTHEDVQADPQAYVDKTIGAGQDEVGEAASVDRSYPYEVPMPENVDFLPTETSNDLPVELILRQAFDSKLTDIVVVGQDEDGNEYVLRSNTDPAEAVWWLQRGVHILNLRCDRRMMEKHGVPLDDHPNPSA